MRLPDEEQPDEPRSYASGGIVVGPSGSDTVQAYINPHESYITAADLREMRDNGCSEWVAWALSETVPELQGEEVIGYGYGYYENSSARNVAFLLKLALDRDDRFNTEERAEYNRTLVELEFGAGFFQRAHP